MADFREGFAEADGFRIRYMEAGKGPALVHLHGAGGLRLSPAHDLLAKQFRVVACEMPGFGASAENAKTQSMPELAATMAAAADQLGLDGFNLMGTSFGSKTALWLALQQPERVLGLVLESPAAIRARTQKLVARLRGPDRDRDLETQLSRLKAPALVVFGTRDTMIPPEMGHFYKELIPNCHLIFVYDAGHAIGAERPEAFVEVVGDFLERHEAFVISRTETVIHP